jgi:hypothetical protein
VHPKGVLCVVIGHRWVQPPEFHESYPVFECRRCGREQAFTQGSLHAGLDARVDAETRASKAFIGDGDH